MTENDAMAEGQKMANAVRRICEEFRDETYTFSVSLLACLLDAKMPKPDIDAILEDHAYNVRMVLEASDVAGRA